MDHASSKLGVKKGCSACTKRRIRCDRGQPSCQKCQKKGITCPGYVSKLRWAGGAAVRGDLTGLQAQATERWTFPSPNAMAEARATNIESLGGFSLAELVDYYDKTIAPRMVWFDSENNIYRRHILPLAQDNKVVRLAVAAVSAQHAARRRGDRVVPEDARNEAVRIITNYINDVTRRGLSNHDPNEGLDVNAAEWILASMLVLSCYEMAHSGAEAAEFHRKAARSLVKALSTTDYCKSRFFTSMRNKLSIYEVFGCTTSFDLQTIQDAILPNPADEMIGCDETTLFLGYVNLLHEVTLLGRLNAGMSPSTIHEWKGKFETARGTTLMAIGRHAINLPAHHRDLIRLVDIHYNSALLYTIRCLSLAAADERQASLSDVLRQISAMEDIDQWMHNLPWPLFVAGAESYGDSEKQMVISSLHRRMSDVTGLQHYHDVLSFLDAFWAGDQPDWQELAREWEMSGRRILAY